MCCAAHDMQWLLQIHDGHAGLKVLTFCGDGNKTLRAGRRTGLRMDKSCRPGVSWADEGLAGPSELCMSNSGLSLQVQTHASSCCVCWGHGAPGGEGGGGSQFGVRGRGRVAISVGNKVL